MPQRSEKREQRGQPGISSHSSTSSTKFAIFTASVDSHTIASSLLSDMRRAKVLCSVVATVQQTGRMFNEKHSPRCQLACVISSVLAPRVGTVHMLDIAATAFAA